MMRQNCVLICRWLPLVLVIIIISQNIGAQEAASTSNLPGEIRGLQSNQLSNPPSSCVRFVLPDSVTDKSQPVVWLKIRIDRQGYPLESRLVFCSHEGLNLDQKAVALVRNKKFAPPDIPAGVPYKWLYHSVTFETDCSSQATSQSPSPTQKETPVQAKE